MPNQNQEDFIDPYATDKDEAALAALDEEIKQASQSLEADFAKFAASKIDEKSEELFFENKEEFFKQVCQWQNEFLQNLRAKQGEAENLRQTIGMKKNFSQIQKAQEEFQKNHPDVNLDELMEFYTNDLSPRVKTELDKLEPNAFFNALFEEFKKAKGEGEPQKETKSLPQRLEGANTDLNAQNGEDSTFNRY